jgi:membrane protease YdiL (CAAX protease family)
MFEEMSTRDLLRWMVFGMLLSVFLLVPLSSNVLWANIGFQLVFYIAPACYFSSQFKKQQVPLSRVVFFRGSLRWFVPLVGLAVLAMAFSLGMVWLHLRMLTLFAPGTIDYFLAPAPFPDNTAYLVAISLIVAIIGPIAEEFIFRGLLLKRLIVKTSVWEGIGLSSLLFAMLHMNFFGAFLFAVTASMLYLLTDNLLIPILLHIFHNSLVIAQTFISPDSPEWLMLADSSDIYTKAVPNAIVLLVSSVLILAVILRLAQSLHKKKEEEKYRAALKKEAEALLNEPKNPEML